jgi:hypothetical protein
MALEDYKKQKKAAAEKENPTPDSGKTLTDIASNSEEAKLFGAFIQQRGDQQEADLAARFMAKQLEQGDMEKLAELRKLHNEKMDGIKRIEGAMTEEYVQEFAENHPYFKNIVGLVGPKKAADAIKKQMRELAATDPDRFDELKMKMDRMLDHKEGEMKQVDAKILEHCKKLGISEKVFLESLKMETAKERNAHLAQHIKKSYGAFKSAGNFLSFGRTAKKEAIELARQKEEMDEALEELEFYMMGVGGTLDTIVEGNEDMRQVFTNIMHAEDKGPIAQERLDMKQAGAEAEQEKVQLQKRWETEKKKTPGYENLSDDDKDALREQFINEEKNVSASKEAARKKKGLWASFIGMFGIESIKKEDLK